MAKNAWGIEFERDAICSLKKQTGEVVRVRIEGVTVNKGQQPLYDVREVETAVGYPASQSSLKRESSCRPR